MERGKRIVTMRGLVYVIVMLFTINCSLFTLSCSSIDCPVENTVRTYYKICNSDGTELQLEEALSVYSKRRDGSDTILFDGPDTLLLNRGTKIKSFSLPVSYSHPEDILIFEYSDLTGDVIYATDTVWIKKDDIPHFESVDCNVSFFHHITDVRYTTNFIDSLVIKERSVTYDRTKIHFILYLDIDD